VTTENERDYREFQYNTQVWVWGVVWLIAASAWYAFIQQVVRDRPVANHPASDGVIWAVFLICGFCLPALVWWSRLETTVDKTGITVRFRPLWKCVIAFDDLQSCERKRYRPLVDYWGWGIRWTPWRGWAYCVSGDLGIQCALKDGRQILIGTQRPAELFDAIQAHLPKADPSEPAASPPQPNLSPD